MGRRVGRKIPIDEPLSNSPGILMRYSIISSLDLGRGELASLSAFAASTLPPRLSSKINGFGTVYASELCSEPKPTPPSAEGVCAGAAVFDIAEGGSARTDSDTLPEKSRAFGSSGALVSEVMEVTGRGKGESDAESEGRAG